MSDVRGVTIVLGAQWGDEGKGKLIDWLSADFDIVCRCQGGNNAGHTVVVGDQAVVHHFHLIPAGAANPNTELVIGNGCVVHLGDLFAEIQTAKALDIETRLFLSPRAHIVTDLHKQLDVQNETSRGKDCIGTTRKGIGPCYASKAERLGIRICDFLTENRDELIEKYKRLYEHHNQVYSNEQQTQDRKFHEKYRSRVLEMCRHGDLSVYLSAANSNGKRILVEGANGAMLDIDFGTYPYVTSSNCTTGGAITGLGIPPFLVSRVFGVMKAYTTRVGDGPFPTELKNEIANELREKGREYGVTTGRPRRCGWLDLVQMKHSVLVNGFTEIMMTKLDTLGFLDSILVAKSYRYPNGSEKDDSFPCTVDECNKLTPIYQTFDGWKNQNLAVNEFEDLPQSIQKYVRFVEQTLRVHIKWIGVGPERNQLVHREK